VLTRRIVNLVSRSVGATQLGPVAREYGAKFSISEPEAYDELAVRELALVVFNGLILVVALGLTASSAAVFSSVGSDEGFKASLAILIGAATWAIAGLFLHLTRYYVVLSFGSRRVTARREENTVKSDGWPGASSDLDFVVQLAAAAVAIGLWG
jgi:hypothetical protein